MTYGTVIIRGIHDYVVFAEPYQKGSGYQVVPKETDPHNKYDIEDVRRYCSEHPENVLYDYEERPLSASQHRKKLYATLRYKLVGDNPDGVEDVTRPFFGTFTVDEMTERAMQYLGDDQDIVVATLAGKAEAKAYIRSLF